MSSMNKTSQVLVFLIFVLPLSLWAAEPSFYVNLQDFPLYLKAGFDDTAGPDLQARLGGRPSWQEFTGWNHIIISKLKLPDQTGRPERAFLSPFGRPEQEWTIAIPFTVEGSPPAFPGLYLAAIGDNWEIYLNGTLVRSEMHLDGNNEPKVQRIRQHHSEREVFFP